MARADVTIVTHGLVVEGVSVEFGGLHALSDASMTVQDGQIHGLIGPNGAGKTTLFNVLNRFIAPSAGRVEFRGQDVLALRPHQLVAVGIARTFQNPQLFRDMTVLDNVMTGGTSWLRPGIVSAALRLPAYRSRERQLRSEAAAALDRVGLGGRAAVVASRLLFSEQRLLELARALVARPRLVLLDEPFSGLTREESEQLVDLLGQLVAAERLTILVIEHNMEIVMRLCDHLTVLNFGRKIAEGAPKEIQDDPEVIRAYLGEDVWDAAGG